MIIHVLFKAKSMKQAEFQQLQAGDQLRHFLRDGLWVITRIANGRVVLACGKQTETITRHNYGQWDVVAKADVAAPA